MIIRNLTGLTILGFLLVGTPALAEPGLDEAPDIKAMDQHGVELITLKSRFTVDTLQIGSGPMALRHILYSEPNHFNSLPRDNFTIQIKSASTLVTTKLEFSLGRMSTIFRQENGAWVPDVDNGESLTEGASSWTWRLSDGTTIHIDELFGNLSSAVLDFIEYPDGRYIRVTRDASDRVVSIVQNNGLMLKYLYNGNARYGIVGVNLAVDYCDRYDTSDCTFSQPWPMATWAWTDLPGSDELFTVTNSENATMKFLHQPGYFGGRNITQVKPFDSDVYTLTYNYDDEWSCNTDGCDLVDYDLVESVDALAGTWTYGRSYAGDYYAYSNSTSPRGTTIVVDYELDGDTLRIKNSRGRWVFFKPDGATIESSTAPEQSYFYDDRGNLERVETIGTLIETAVFPSTCAYPETCNKPTSVTDARNGTTDYHYHPHNGMPDFITEPPDDNGVRPKTFYEYAERHAWVKDAAGGYRKIDVDGQRPIWVQVAKRSCRNSLLHSSGQFCLGGDEVLVEYDFGPDAGPNNLLVRGEVITADGVSLRTCFTHDAYGNKISETEAKANLASCPIATSASDFTTDYRYTVAGQLTGSISPDPDGSGPLKYAAVRNTYDPDTGLLIRTETGELASWQSAAIAPADWTGFQVRTINEYGYDTYGRKTLHKRGDAGGATLTLSQFSYDADNLLECEAVRMNPAVYDNLPTSACAHSTEGLNGPDRITRYTYDDHGRRLKIEKGYLTNTSIDYATYTYQNAFHDGPETVTDANGNKARMAYDSLYRPEFWYFPSKTIQGQWSQTDFEQYDYDENGNRTYFRKRDQRQIHYTYDALDRMTVKNIPGSTEDVYYGYDLRGLQLYARFGSHTGEGITNVYDGFGRLENSTNNMDGQSRTLSYQYDRNGNRTRITHPDGKYFRYEYDGLNRHQTIRADAANTLLLTNAYDTSGRRSGVAWLSGTETNARYDALSRLEWLGLDLSGGQNDVETDFAYSPASQILSRSICNDAYIYASDENRTGSYVVNGLNQYTNAGGQVMAYDDNGNLTSDGQATGYVYDIENRLIQVTGTTPTTLRYDPLGRLYELVSNGATTRFLYDGDALVAEYDGNGSLLQRYLHGTSVNEPFVWYSGSAISNPRFLHSDHQGSIVSVSDGSATSLAINTYDAYGIPAPTNLGRFSYTGQIYLSEIGLYHYKARVYSPTLGRFLQTDPVGYEDQMNLYAYVGNDPITMIDPSGEFLVGAAWGAAVSIVAEGALQVLQGEFDASRLAVAAASGALAGLTGVGLVAATKNLGVVAQLAIRSGGNTAANAGIAAGSQALNNVTDGDSTTSAGDGVVAAGFWGAASGALGNKFGALADDALRGTNIGGPPGTFTGAAARTINGALDVGAEVTTSVVGDKIQDMPKYPNDGAIPLFGGIKRLCTSTIGC